MRSSLRLLCVAALAASSCSGDGTESPRPSSVEPATGLASASTRVVIRGDGFLARLSERQSGGGAAVDAQHRVWLGDAELEAVTWIDSHTLEATVPAGLMPGPKRLVVENAFGRSGALDGAFEVIATASAVLEVALDVAPAATNAGQPITVTLTVRNTGGGATRAVVPEPLSLGGTAADGAAVDGPVPASAERLEPGATATFSWSVIPAVPGALTLTARARGVDGLSSAEVTSPAAEASAQAQAPAELAATIAASRSTANVGQVVAVTLTLVNGGAARANLGSVQPGTAGPSASCGPVSPALPQSVATGEVLRFTWSCTASEPGALALLATIAAVDGTSGAPLSAEPSAPAQVTVQTPAALTAALAVQGSPTAVLVGQALSVTLTVSDTGQAGVTVTQVTPTVSPPGAATCGAPSPVPPQTLTGLGARTFAWSCTALTAGSLSLGAGVTGTDANTGATTQATAPPLSFSALLPAVLTATMAASRATVDVGQPVTATFTLTNGGTATANVTAITPSRTGTATASCGSPTPAPAPITAGGSSTFTWTCTASTAGTLILSGTATGTDAVSGATISATPATPATVAVQTPAALSATLAVQGSPTAVLVGQALNVTLTISDTGQAGVTVTQVTPTVSPPGAATCGAPSPSPPQGIAGLGSRSFAWSCTALTAGSLSLGAGVTGTDANTGATLQATAPAVSLSVLLPAALTATISASRATVDVGQPVTATFTLTNGGTATANVTAVTPVTSGTAVASCGPVSPGPAPIAAGGSSTFTWTCTPTAPGTLRLSGTATGTDAVSGATISATPATTATVAVQTPAALTASLAVQGNPTTALVGAALSLTLTVSDTGQAGATLTQVTPTASPPGAATCGAPSPSPPQGIAGLGSTTFTWTCTTLAAGGLSLGAGVTGTDANTGATIQASAPVVNLAVQTPAAVLTATIAASRSAANVGQPVTATLTVTNGGSATANVTAVTPVTSGTAIESCGPVSPAPTPIAAGGSSTFTWTCTPTAAGTLVLSGTVTGTDAISGAPLSATPTTPAAVTVQTPALLAPAALQAGRTTADVGQAVTVTLILTNQGQAAASVAAVANAATGTASCTSATPATPQTVPGGGSLTFGWTCTGTASGTMTLSATVTASDVNSGASVSPTVTPIDVLVQTPAVLTATPPLAVTPSGPVAAGTAVTLTLSLLNGGQASARVVSVTPTSSPGGANSTCTGVTPAPPQDVAESATATFSWTCTLNKPATAYSLGSTVTATDLNTGAPLTVTVPTVTVTTN